MEESQTTTDNTGIQLKELLSIPALWGPILVLFVSSTLPFINLCGSPCGFTCCGDYQPLNIFAYAALGREEGAGAFILIFLLASVLSILLVILSKGRSKPVKIGYTILTLLHLGFAALLLLASLLGRPTIGLILVVFFLLIQLIVSFLPFAWRPLGTSAPDQDNVGSPA